MDQRPFSRTKPAIRWVDDEPQPGLVEVGFTDAHHQQWTYIDKWPVFSGEDLHPTPAIPSRIETGTDSYRLATTRARAEQQQAVG